MDFHNGEEEADNTGEREWAKHIFTSFKWWKDVTFRAGGWETKLCRQRTAPRSSIKKVRKKKSVSPISVTYVGLIVKVEDSDW